MAKIKSDLTRRELETLKIIALKAKKHPENNGVVEINSLEPEIKRINITENNLRTNITRLRKAGYLRFATMGCVVVESKGMKALEAEIEKSDELQSLFE